MIQRDALGALLASVPLICATADEISAKDAYEKATGGFEQVAFLGSITPQLHTSSTPEFRENLKDDSLSAKMHHDQGVNYADKGQYDLALSEFNKALEIDPRSAATYNNKGIAYSKKGDLDHAVAAFTIALAINPNDAKAYYNRGITYAIKGQAELALADPEKSLAIEPTNAAAYHSIGDILVSLACPYWEKACQLGHCDLLEKAAQIDLCVAAPRKSPLSP